MTSIITKHYLQYLTNEPAETTQRPLTKEERKQWKKHVKEAVDHIQELVLKCAENGNYKFVMEGFTSRSPTRMRKEWKRSIAENSTLSDQMYPNTGMYISERCLKDIVKKLRKRFPDSNISELSIDVIEHWGLPEHNVVHFLIVDWS
jgi:hypothetical protein